MSPAARELGLLSAAKAKEPMLALARQMRASSGKPPLPALAPTLVLSLGDRV